VTLNVSQTKISDWRRCKLAYHFKHVEHLAPRIIARPLRFGTLAHQMFEARAQGADPYKTVRTIYEKEEKAFRESEEYYGKIVDDLSYIMRAYEKTVPPLQYIPIKINTSPGVRKKRTAELPFEIPLDEKRGINLKGTIDGIVKYNKIVAVLENKTHDIIPNADHRWRSLQSAVYLRVVETLGWARPQGMLWNYVRSKVPTRPKINADGKMSLDMRIDTLPEVIIDTAKAAAKEGHLGVELQLKHGAIQPLIDKAQSNLHTWFERVFTPINPGVIRMLWGEMLDTAIEIYDYYKRFGHSTEPPRNVGIHCSWCAYEKICRAELLGMDVETVRKYDYQFDDSYERRHDAAA
jgi:hypothetical protein